MKCPTQSPKGIGTPVMSTSGTKLRHIFETQHMLVDLCKGRHALQGERHYHIMTLKIKESGLCPKMVLHSAEIISRMQTYSAGDS